jgi:nucleoside-diphosphate-sugar epimerase
VIVLDETSNAEALTAPFTNGFMAYCAAKIAAYKATKDFVANKKPAFDVVTLMPTFIIGKNELVTEPKYITDGTNGLVLRQILGINGSPTAGGSVHLNDIAKAHVLALDPKVPRNLHFLLNADIVWGDAINIVAKNYPQAVAAGILPNNGILESTKLNVNASKAEEIFGFKYLSYEEQVKSVTSHYLELVGVDAA